KCANCGSSAPSTSGSTGIRPPKSGVQATRSPSVSDSSGGAKLRPGSDNDSGARGSGPAIADSSRATSATVRAIGPWVDSVEYGVESGQFGTRPGVGRKPTMLQKDAGLRSEPPVSLPSAIGNMPVASPAAAPPLLPPA